MKIPDLHVAADLADVTAHAGGRPAFRPQAGFFGLGNNVCAQLPAEFTSDRLH